MTWCYSAVIIRTKGREGWTKIDADWKKNQAEAQTPFVANLNRHCSVSFRFVSSTLFCFLVAVLVAHVKVAKMLEHQASGLFPPSFSLGYPASGGPVFGQAQHVAQQTWI